MPARVRKPKDKALVEDAVKLTYQNIYTRLEGQVFYDLESMNKAVWVALEIFNNKPMSNDLIACHKRSFRIFEYVTDNEHLPANHKKMLTWDPVDLLKEASNLHPDLELYLEKVISEKKYPEQS